MSEPLSPRNAEVARLRALTRQRRERREAGRFIVEGYKLVAEALASPLEVEGIWFDPDWQPAASMLDAADEQHVPLRAVTSRGIERIASTSTPQPVVAEVELPPIADVENGHAVLGSAKTVLALVDINDPGNVGTLVRSGEAAGFDAVMVVGETADAFGPKAVRASAGAVLRVNVVELDDRDTALSLLADAGLERVGTRMHDAVPCDTADLTGRIAVVLGSEAHGLGLELGADTASIDRWVAIPMSGSVESLNVAMAGTILTYEIGRQRRQMP